jgi:hypothetical protein
MTMQPHGLGIGTICATLVVFGANVAAAQAPRGGPCAQIIATCEQAGFERGGGRAGDGIVVDCARPIMLGGAQPRRAAKPLPQVAPELVEACRASNPNFAQRRAPPSPQQQQPQSAAPPGPN